jgi:aryl-alcohol dehydrogenase-like predicted oxidoreductase
MGMSFAYGASARDDAESIRVIQRAIDLGVTLIDTADVYGPFTNEELVGRALAGRRDQITLASKCGLVIKDGEITPQGHPDHIRHAAEASLQRLGVETIDLYQLHRVDPTMPIEDTWGAMAELVKAGSVRAIGMSEVTAEQLTAAHAIHPVATVQSELSLWSTDQLEEVVPWCRANGAAFIAYAPLGRGFLTGTLASAAQLEGADWRNTNPRFSSQSIDANQRLVDIVRAVAVRHGATPAQVALAWVLGLGDDIVPIPGTKRLRYLEENVAAVGIKLTGSDLAELSAIADHVVGNRY